MQNKVCRATRFFRSLETLLSQNQGWVRNAGPFVEYLGADSRREAQGRHGRLVLRAPPLFGSKVDYTPSLPCEHVIDP